ncbi:MAG: hypothetical protein CMP22_02690 [Rickettsiales bacterium]|nr:hypothetical protein [Rickettsiales bacterium]|tara:strand:+ start:790 stop:1587 length:798 start_codon:yes stop_codon:yes gene_type:complete
MSKNKLLLQSILNERDKLEQDQNDLQNSILPIFKPRDLPDYIMEVKELRPAFGHPVKMRANQVIALAKVYLDDTAFYMKSLKDKIPPAPKGFLSKQSDFQTVMVDTAFDLSPDLGVLFLQLHSKLTENELQEILENPEELHQKIELKRLGLESFIDKSDFEDTADRVWEFSMMVGGPMIFNLACIRNHYGQDSSAYKQSKVIMEDWLAARQQAFEILASGRLLKSHKQNLVFDKDQLPDWDCLEERASFAVGRMFKTSKARKNGL